MFDSPEDFVQFKKILPLLNRFYFTQFLTSENKQNFKGTESKL